MIEKEILTAVNRFSMLTKGNRVTVALSGGADSIALAFALVQLKDKLKIEVSAAHLNHLIRGEEAFRDEEFVKSFCKEYNIPLTVERIDVPQFAKNNSLSLEAAARNIRYEFFKRLDTDYIATAHTASDNLETVLLNLTRGTALDGIAGIPPVRDNIIRPLILSTREMIENYCKDNDIGFITDSTNLTDDYTRNNIRHNVVPVLKRINPKVENAVLRTSFNLREISEKLSFTADDYISENLNNGSLILKDFKSLDKATAKRVIIKFIGNFDKSISLEACHIEEIYNVCLKGGKTGIPNNKHCCNSKGVLTVVENDLFHNKATNFGEISLKKQKILKTDEKINNLFLNNCLDCDKIVGKLIIRTRMPGDKIRLLNRGCTKALTKLYNEYSVPPYLRNSLPVIADDNGVVWVYSIGVADRCSVNKNTTHFYEVIYDRKEV